jgi:hypothetical protein
MSDPATPARTLPTGPIRVNFETEIGVKLKALMPVDLDGPGWCQARLTPRFRAWAESPPVGQSLRQGDLDAGRVHRPCPECPADGPYQPQRALRHHPVRTRGIGSHCARTTSGTPTGTECDHRQGLSRSTLRRRQATGWVPHRRSRSGPRRGLMARWCLLQEARSALDEDLGGVHVPLVIPGDRRETDPGVGEVRVQDIGAMP